ncbi:MAG: hypothetical protein ACT4PM_11085 [Gemmatimonadales bacterium]
MIDSVPRFDIGADQNDPNQVWSSGPARFTPSWIGDDRTIGLWRNPDDVPQVRAYRLVR